MEVRAQTRVLLQPVFVIGFQPVDLPVFEGEEGHCPEHLAIILHIIHPVILRQSLLQRLLQLLIGRIADAQHINAVPAQPVAEVPIGMGELGGNKNKIHLKYVLSIGG